MPNLFELLLLVILELQTQTYKTNISRIKEL